VPEIHADGRTIFRRVVAGSFVAVAVGLLAQTSSTASVPTHGVPRASALQRIARSLVAAGAPGAIVFVKTPKGVRSAAAGLAQLRPAVRMRVGNHYRIGSITKTFVATAVLQLVGDGKLTLDEPVERVLPGLVPNGAAITLRMLLNHTSGLYDYVNDTQLYALVTVDLSREWKPRELLGFAFSHPPLFAPGSATSYSNTGYVVLGLVVEAVTGKPLGQVLRERIFQPLRLADTSIGSGIAMPQPVAHGYWAPHGALEDLTASLNMSVAYAGGQMVSTVRDLSTFFAALLQGRLVPRGLLSEMKRAPAPKTGWVAGLGLLTTRTPCGAAFGHGGDALGWHDEALATADGRRVAVVMVNYDPDRLDGRFVGAQAALCAK
jgi:D-alanyl-D-alanine carboxypeptidase